MFTDEENHFDFLLGKNETHADRILPITPYSLLMQNAQAFIFGTNIVSLYLVSFCGNRRLYANQLS